jgi:hypothetical protein
MDVMVLLGLGLFYIGFASLVFPKFVRLIYAIGLSAAGAWFLLLEAVIDHDNFATGFWLVVLVTAIAGIFVCHRR